MGRNKRRRESSSADKDVQYIRCWKWGMLTSHDRDESQKKSSGLRNFSTWNLHWNRCGHWSVCEGDAMSLFFAGAWRPPLHQPIAVASENFFRDLSRSILVNIPTTNCDNSSGTEYKMWDFGWVHSLKAHRNSSKKLYKQHIEQWCHLANLTELFLVKVSETPGAGNPHF